MNDKINEYSGTNVEIRLIFMKAWIYVGNKQFGLALNIAESIDENSLSDENKMRYYLIMMEIYNKMGNDTLKKEYTEKYRQLYKAMFKDADKEPEDDETINNEDNENGGMYEN
jgi:formaldehyde-activating enzyme involved in methanogenesis